MKYFAEWGVTAQGMYYIEGQIQDKDFRYTKTTFEYVVTFKTSGEGGNEQVDSDGSSYLEKNWAAPQQ